MTHLYDGEWRSVIDLPSAQVHQLRDQGFQFGRDSQGHMQARWPLDPALTFVGEPLAYWQGEIALDCRVSLNRLRKICEERGCDFGRTVEVLR